MVCALVANHDRSRDQPGILLWALRVPALGYLVQPPWGLPGVSVSRARPPGGVRDRRVHAHGLSVVVARAIRTRSHAVAWSCVLQLDVPIRDLAPVRWLHLQHSRQSRQYPCEPLSLGVPAQIPVAHRLPGDGGLRIVADRSARPDLSAGQDLRGGDHARQRPCCQRSRRPHADAGCGSGHHGAPVLAWHQ